MKNFPSSRRSFLNAVVTATAALAAPLARGESAVPGWKTAVGLNGFQSGARKYKKTYPIWEVAAFASRDGFDGVELVWDWPMGSYPLAAETARVQALKRFWDSFGLRIFSIQLGADGAFSADPDIRSRWLETFADRIQLARQLGCACVGMWPYGVLGKQTVDEAIEKLGQSFHQAAKMAQDHGIIAAFEIEPPFAFHTEQNYRAILAAADHPNFKGIYDPSHFDLMSGSTGRPHEMLQRVGVKNIGYVQFTDGDGTLRDGGTSKHLGCGDGHIDVPASLRTLRDGGFRGWIMIDEWEVPDAYDACIKGMKAIKEAWNEKSERCESVPFSPHLSSVAAAAKEEREEGSGMRGHARQIVRCPAHILIIAALLFAVPLAHADSAPDPYHSGFARTYWYEPAEPYNPHYEKRFRVNSPETVLHHQFGQRVEARENGLMLIRAEEDLRWIAAADLYLETWGGHPGTAHKRVSINGRHTYELPEAGTAKKSCTHAYPVLPLARTDLVNGYDALQFACDQGSSFWGHFIVDEACLRLWLSNSHPAVIAGQFGSLPPQVQAVTDEAEVFTLSLVLLPEKFAAVSSVDYQGFYTGFDENGDGKDRDWHGFTRNRQPVGWIGSATNAPFAVRWDTSMLPGQSDMAVRAVLHFRNDTNLVYLTEPVRKLRTSKRNARVDLEDADDLPRPFWSRAGQKKSCKIEVETRPENIERAELHVVTWAGGAGSVKNYFTLNGHPLPAAEGAAHDVQYHRIPIDRAMLRKGDNEVVLLSDTGHHGIEVLLPGPALVIRERK